MKKILVLLSLALIASCKEKDLTENNPAPAPENVILKTSFLYENEIFHSDSVLVNNEGFRFFITDVQLVLSNFFFVNGGDTVSFEEEPFIVNRENTDQELVEMPLGSYSGHYGLRVGLDSATSATISASSLPEGNELKNSNVFRNDGQGVDNVIIKGRLIDPFDPTDSTGSIPLEYRLGTYATSKLVTSTQLNFILEKGSEMPLIMQVDIGPVLDDINLEARPLIVTDDKNQVDYEIALAMADSLKIGLY